MPGFNGLGKDNCTTRRQKIELCDLVRLILEILRYISSTISTPFTASSRILISNPVSAWPILYTQPSMFMDRWVLGMKLYIMWQWKYSLTKLYVHNANTLGRHFCGQKFSPYDFLSFHSTELHYKRHQGCHTSQLKTNPWHSLTITWNSLP